METSLVSGEIVEMKRIMSTRGSQRILNCTEEKQSAIRCLESKNDITQLLPRKDEQQWWQILRKQNNNACCCSSSRKEKNSSIPPPTQDSWSITSSCRENHRTPICCLDHFWSCSFFCFVDKNPCRPQVDYSCEDDHHTFVSSSILFLLLHLLLWLDCLQALNTKTDCGSGHHDKCEEYRCFEKKPRGQLCLLDSVSLHRVVFFLPVVLPVVLSVDPLHSHLVVWLHWDSLYMLLDSLALFLSRLHFCFRNPSSLFWRSFWEIYLCCVFSSISFAWKMTDLSLRNIQEWQWRMTETPNQTNWRLASLEQELELTDCKMWLSLCKKKRLYCCSCWFLTSSASAADFLQRLFVPKNERMSGQRGWLRQQYWQEVVHLQREAS